MARKDPNQPVDQKSPQPQYQTKDQELAQNGASAGINKLWHKGQHKEDHLWITEIDQKTLDKGPMRGGARELLYRGGVPQAGFRRG